MKKKYQSTAESELAEFQSICEKISVSIQSLSTIRILIDQANNELKYAFNKKVPINILLKARSTLVDCVLTCLWQMLSPPTNNNATLIAVGGYGREEMHPYSDVDILILLANKETSEDEVFLSNFITQLWDLKLDIGHSVRTLTECTKEAGKDLSVITNLIESRYLIGEKTLYQQLQNNISTEKMWDSQAFLSGKLKEQENRYSRYGDTAYCVEPNLKEGPGGLRDIHMISWIVQRHYGADFLSSLEHDSILMSDEYETLIKAREFLWRVRFALHINSNRKEDRLLFDQQKALAKQFDFVADTHGSKDVEAFMQAYYRTITLMERFNDMLMGILHERIFTCSHRQRQTIDDYYFQSGYEIGIVDEHFFVTHPHTLLEIFLILEISENSKALTPNTIRQIQRYLPLIDDDYRNNPRHQAIFIAILSQPKRITFIMRLMNRYGVLAAWIPAFENIVGRMQFDLFHTYTVDEHTLRVICNLRRFSTQHGLKEYPHCYEVFQSLTDHKLLYLAGLFHDIAKGRGGDHSTLGAVDAYHFCHKHGLSHSESSIVSWLVRFHLLMSTTAQRKDISDSVVIHEFANQVMDSQRLDYLYLLTIADMKGTNPELLSNWKYTLIKQLYDVTKNLLQHGLPPATFVELIEQKKQSVENGLVVTSVDKSLCAAYYELMGDDYLIQNETETILWHMPYIINQLDTLDPIIQVRPTKQRGSSQLFVYALKDVGCFTCIVSIMERLNLNIIAANSLVLENNHALSTLYFLNTDNQSELALFEQEALVKRIRNHLLNQDERGKPTQQHLQHRRLKHFDSPTSVEFSQDTERKQTILTVKTGDMPGLLSILSECFNQHNVRITSARITTLGEVAEDIFNLINNSDQRMLSPEKQESIRRSLLVILD